MASPFVGGPQSSLELVVHMSPDPRTPRQLPLQGVFQFMARLPWQGKLALLLLVGLYLVAAPIIETRWGIELPGVFALPADPPPRERDLPAPQAPPPQIGTPTVFEQLAGHLKETSPSTFVSPAGLVYKRGSQQGHRLEHLMTHAEDQPQRPGSHGVFEPNDPLEVVQVVDEAFRLAQLGKQTRRRVEEGRTIYTVDLGRPIGYVGGESGARRRHPRARHVRLIVEGNEFITAFPVVP